MGTIIGVVRAIIFGGLVFLVLQVVAIAPLADTAKKSLAYQMLKAKVYEPFKESVTSNLSKRPQINKQLNKVVEQWTQFGKFMDLNIARLYHIDKLPNTDHVRVVNLRNGVSISAGDNYVSEEELKLGANTLTHVTFPTLEGNLGISPENTSIVIFSSKQTYAAALAMAGISSQELLNMVSKTGGITVGSNIWINWSALEGNSELANALTHEITHSVFNQEGIGNSIPTWVNEGTAWFDGMDAQKKVSLTEADQITQAYDQQLRQVARSGQLLPLSASEQDILNAPYNVEWEDYRAVNELIQRYGLGKYRRFIGGVKNGVEKSFQSNFGISMNSYMTRFEEEISSK